MKKIFSLTLFFIIASFTRAQDLSIDSLRLLVKESKADTVKMYHLNTLSRELINIGEYEEALRYAKEALDFSSHRRDQDGISREAANAHKNIGIVYWYQGDNGKALESYMSARKLYGEIGDMKGIADTYVTMGIIYDNQGSYDKALENYIYSLKIYEKLGHRQRIAMTYNNIGLIYKNQGNFKKALKNHYAALKIDKDLGNKGEIASDYNNIAICYSELGEYDKALENHSVALKIELETGDKHGLALSYNNIGLIYYEQANMLEWSANAETKKMIFRERDLLYNKALENYFAALKIREEIGDMQGIVVSHNSIGNVFLKQDKIGEAKEHSLKSLEIAKEIGWKERMMYAYNSLSRCDSAAGDWKGAYEYNKLYSSIKDSIFNEESNKQIEDMSARYETEKKEAQIRLLEKNEEVINAENKRQQQVIYFVSGGLFLLLILSGVILKSLQNNRRKNKIITSQKLEVEAAKQIIEHRHKEQTDSISYAKRLQEAILPPLALVNNHFPENFIFYQPKDIVAGDFYWMEFIEDIVFIAAADCTGHGVPGAMVSVVCSNALTRSVKEFGLRDTGKILDKVTELVQETFEKSVTDVYDGMDISLLSFNKLNSQVTWSGANNPLWYIFNGELKEIKGDKQPIGKYLNRKPFSSHSLPSSKGSVFYLFTDGYPDQFGGPDEKKYMYRRFQKNLFAHSGLPMSEQKNLLENSFTEWKGSLEQVDDVTVIGIKI